MAHLRRFYVWFIFDLAQQKTCFSTCLSIRVLTERSAVSYTVRLFICSPMQAVGAALDSLMHFDQQAVDTSCIAIVNCGDFAQCSVFALYLICKEDKTQLSKCGNLPVCLNNDMTSTGSFKSGLRGITGGVNPIRRMFQLSLCTL